MMKNFDHLSLDGRSLYMIKLIYELRSVTLAARQLGVTQSTVSHALERMRSLLGDPLFLKTGRTMVPTERVEGMIGDIEAVLTSLDALQQHSLFDPGKAQERFTIMCNDFEHDLLVPAIFARLREDAPGCSLRTFSNHAGSFEEPDKGEVDIRLYPFPPMDAPDLVVTPLCTDWQVTYFDPARRSGPTTLEEFAASEHGILSIGSNETTTIDRVLKEHGLSRRVSYLGPSFSAIAMAVKGTDMLATAPSRMASSIFQNFAAVPTPVPLDPIDFYMIWHVRHRASPRHKWFRNLIKSVAKSLPEISDTCEEHLGRFKREEKAASGL